MADAVRGTSELVAWLAPFLEVMGRKTRRSWAPLYLRGLLGPGERKSLQPVAMGLGLPGHDRICQLSGQGCPAWQGGAGV